MKQRVIVLIACMCLIAGFGFSQKRTGNIYGKVVDDGENALPGILITLSGDLIGKMTTISNSNGNFKFISLSPGVYDIKAEVEGFATLVRKDIRVQVGSNISVTLPMQQKKINEEVVVTAAPIVIDQKKVTHATNLSREELQTLPSARDPFVMLEMAPGIVMDRVNVGGSESGQQSNFRSSGSYRSGSNWNMDGINNTDQVAMGAAPQYFDFDAFDEIQIQTAANDITSMTAGAQINLITRRGGNKFSGGGRFYLTDDSFQGDNAPSDFPEAYTPEQINSIKDYGLNIGGPIIKDKLWFWVGGSIQDIQKQALVGDVQKQKLKNIEFKANTKFGKHRFEGFFNWSSKDVLGRVSNSTLDAWESHYEQSSPHPFYKIQDEFLVNDNLFVSAKGSYFAGGFLLSPIGEVGGIAIQDDNLGRFLGTYRESDYIRPQKFYQVMATAFADKLLGASHEMKFGLEYKWWLRKRDRTYYSQKLRFRNYSPEENVFVPYRAYIYRDSDLDQPYHRFSAFFQDSLSFNRLTVLVGGRYDIQGGKVNNLNTPGTNVDWAGDLNLPEVNVQEADLNFDWKHFSPRLGLIYDIFGTGKTLAKANFSIYGEHIDTAFTYSLASTYGYVYWDWNDANNDQSVQENEVTRPRVRDFFNQDDPNNIFDPNLKTPKTLELTAGLEHELVRDFAVGANVIYRKYYNDYEIYYYVDDNGVNRLPQPSDWEVGGYIPDEYGGAAWWQYKEGIEEGTAAWYQQRPDYYNKYLALELTFKKRLSAASRWMVNGSVTLQSWKQYYSSPLSYGDNYNPTGHENPDNLNGTPESYISPRWMAKLGFAVQLPLKINLAGSILAREGFVQDNHYIEYGGDKVNGLGSRPGEDTTIYVDRRGSARYPDMLMTNMRLERSIKLSSGRVIFSFDLFNIFNTYAVQEVEDNAGRSTYGELRTIVSPRIFRLGVRLDF
ncbi:MAG: TonB-dependent receptor [bacterium]|nr:TonB-dependent receptor [bacterium]